MVLPIISSPTFVGAAVEDHALVDARSPAPRLRDHRPRQRTCASGTVIGQHARPNALIPVATVSGLTIVGLLNGVVITETIFNYPGIGSATATAAAALDVLTVLGFAWLNATP